MKPSLFSAPGVRNWPRRSQAKVRRDSWRSPPWTRRRPTTWPLWSAP